MRCHATVLKVATHVHANLTSMLAQVFDQVLGCCPSPPHTQVHLHKSPVEIVTMSSADDDDALALTRTNQDLT